MNSIDSDDGSYHDIKSTDILEDIRDRRQSHTNINIREAHCKIHDCIRQRQSE